MFVLLQSYLHIQHKFNHNFCKIFYALKTVIHSFIKIQNASIDKGILVMSTKLEGEKETTNN